MLSSFNAWPSSSAEYRLLKDRIESIFLVESLRFICFLSSLCAHSSWSTLVLKFTLALFRLTLCEELCPREELDKCFAGLSSFMPGGSVFYDHDNA
jgi:hypothetical protein